MEVVKVLPKGQIVIPKHLREKIGLEIGKKAIVEQVNNSILLMPEPKDPLKLMKGLLKQTAKEKSVRVIRKLRVKW